MFSVLSESDRRRHIADMVDVVLGVRLYNKAVGKGGAGIVDGESFSCPHLS